MKKCEDCRQVKSDYDFYKRSDSETRRLNRCKACHIQRSAFYTKRRREARKPQTEGLR